MSEFKKSYMHPTRRKLADMVLTGEYESSTVISKSFNKQDNTKRAVGDTWEDINGNTWVKTEYGMIKQSKLSNILSNARREVNAKHTCKSDKCDVIGKYSNADKKLVAHTGYCAGCLARIETKIQQENLWEQYSEFRQYSGLLKQLMAYMEISKQALVDLENSTDVINEDGTLERWGGGDVKTIKDDILKDIDFVQKKIDEVTPKYTLLLDTFKKLNYDIV